LIVSKTTFKINTDIGGDVRIGTVRITSGAMAGESRLVSWTGSQVTVLSHGSMPTVLKEFSAIPPDGTTLIFKPL